MNVLAQRSSGLVLRHKYFAGCLLGAGDHLVETVRYPVDDGAVRARLISCGVSRPVIHSYGGTDAFRAESESVIVVLGFGPTHLPMDWLYAWEFTARRGW